MNKHAACKVSVQCFGVSSQSALCSAACFYPTLILTFPNQTKAFSFLQLLSVTFDTAPYPIESRIRRQAQTSANQRALRDDEFYTQRVSAEWAACPLGKSDWTVKKLYLRTSFFRHVGDSVDSAGVARISSVFFWTQRLLETAKLLHELRALVSNSSAYEWAWWLWCHRTG